MPTRAEILKREPDFEVSYRFFSEAEGGRKNPPFQGYRSDWAYEGADISKEGIFMIWPEFLDSEGRVLSENVHAPETGRATMWIVVREMIEKMHGARIKVGTKGFFMEGGRRVAEATVTRIIGLHSNRQ
jgi:hypothetical protein